MRKIALAIFLLCSCGAEPPPKPVVAHSAVRDAGADRAIIDASDPLAVDPQSLAPGMKEVIRRDVDIARTLSIDVPISTDADTCVRAAVRSIEPIKARLVAKSGTLAEGTTIGEKGPICVRRGDALTLEITVEDKARARIIIWSSP